MKENLIETFMSNAIKSAEDFDYENKEEIKRHNNAIKNYRNIAEKIKKEGNSLEINNFVELLNNNNWDIKIACAVCIIEILELENYKEKALLTIKEYLKYLKLHATTFHEKTNKIGFELYLKKYKIKK